MTNDLTHIGTCCVLANSRGQVLLGERKNGFMPGYYGMPGGRLRLNEPLLLSAERELLEETGLALPSLRFQGVVRQNQGAIDFIHFVYVAEHVTESPQLCEPDKCQSWQWVEFEQFSGPVLEGHQAAYQLWKSNQSLIDITQDI